MKVFEAITLLERMPKDMQLVTHGYDAKKVFAVVNIFTNIAGSVTIVVKPMDEQLPAQAIPVSPVDKHATMKDLIKKERFNIMNKKELIIALLNTGLPDDAEVLMFSMYDIRNAKGHENIHDVSPGFSANYEGKIIIRNYDPPEICKHPYGIPTPDYEINKE